MSLELDHIGRRPAFHTEGDSRLRSMREPLQRATDVRAPRSDDDDDDALFDHVDVQLE